jgi:hypothetical protein
VRPSADVESSMGRGGFGNSESSADRQRAVKERPQVANTTLDATRL